MATFEEIGIEAKIVQAIEEAGFEKPMPIQEEVIPHLMQENSPDILALAQTGTGKTAAFGLPLIQKTDTTKKHIQHLILSPTRELCLQITNDLKAYSKYKGEIKITAVFGGASIDQQIRAIKKGTHIVSATPGRLLDLIERRVVDLSFIKTVVLDEADEMLNMGFREELKLILEKTPKDKNTLLFSATMPKELLSISNKYMNNPVEITIGKRNSGAENIDHICYMVHEKDRYLALKRIADFYPDIYGIIFCRTRKETQDVADKLLKDGYNADALHGDLSQIQRDAVMNKFRLKSIQLLVATDVAARGLDVDNLTHIINYNLPDEINLYTHRSGRTGRAGRFGISILISNLKEKHKLQQIEKQINKKIKHLPIPLGKEICKKQLFHLIDKMENVEVNNDQIESFMPEIYQKLEWLEREELIKKFVSLEFNRFLEYYKNSSDLNNPAESKSSGNRQSASSGFTRFFINLGRTDKLKPATLIGMINDFTNIRNIEIGEIEILNNFSFFETDSDYAETVLQSFLNKKYKNRQVAVEVAAQKRGGNQNKRKRQENSSQNKKFRKSGTKRNKFKVNRN
jgi:ATP-dependent RNA helicase DeaD